MTDEQLRDFMTRFGLLQIDVALIAGVTPRTVNNWYHGRLPIPRAVGLLLAAVSEGLVSIEWVAAHVPAEPNIPADGP